MITKKVLIGSIVGGIAYFLLGWIIYGILMKDYCAANFDQTNMRPEAEMVLWAMGLANIAAAMLMALIFSWANISTLMSGARVGAIIGFLTAVSLDFSFYAMSTFYKNWSSLFVDILVGTLMSAIVGAVIIWAMNLGSKSE
ncbi:MAG: hypothetical protein KGZ59_06760 [Chitinophagaceae bacterium]|nr:hypothetical protein [Chitinophagaceae bacterium]